MSIGNSFPRYFILISTLVLLTLPGTSCGKKEAPNQPDANISPSGKSIYERFPAPKGFQKAKAANGTWAAYLQEFPLLPNGTKVLEYSGKPISDQKSHVAVLDLDVGSKDLQQCADAIIRLRSEFLWKKGQKDQISFEFTSGHRFHWKDYAKGLRPEVKGNKVNFISKAGEDHSYEAFRKYLDIVFMYAGTISLHRELQNVGRKTEYQIGDVLVHPGSPGHAVIIVDKAKNNKGEAIYLLAQGYTPAQSVHVVKSGHSGISPWFKLPTSGPIWHKRFYLSKVGIRRF